MNVDPSLPASKSALLGGGGHVFKLDEILGKPTRVLLDAWKREPVALKSHRQPEEHAPATASDDVGHRIVDDAQAGAQHAEAPSPRQAEHRIEIRPKHSRVLYDNPATTEKGEQKTV